MRRRRHRRPAEALVMVAPRTERAGLLSHAKPPPACCWRRRLARVLEPPAGCSWLTASDLDGVARAVVKQQCTRAAHQRRPAASPTARPTGWTVWFHSLQGSHTPGWDTINTSMSLTRAAVNDRSAGLSSTGGLRQGKDVKCLHGTGIAARPHCHTLIAITANS